MQNLLSDFPKNGRQRKVFHILPPTVYVSPVTLEGKYDCTRTINIYNQTEKELSN